MLWRDDNQRLFIEPHIEGLKAERNTDGFGMRNGLAAESADLAGLLIFNLLSVYQKEVLPAALCRQSATLRAAVVLGGVAPDAYRWWRFPRAVAEREVG